MLLGAMLVILGAGALYYAFTGTDPRDLLRPGAASAPIPSGTGSGTGTIPPTLPAPTQGTPQVRLIAAALRAIPGWYTIRICGPGSVPCSDHPCCGAIDIGGPRGVLMAVERVAVAAMRSRTLPIAYVIGPDDQCAKGRYFGRDGDSHCYTGPNSHQGHVHISAYPTCGCKGA
jgi:hypothetical protein